MLGGGSDGAKNPLFAGKSSRLAPLDSTGSSAGSRQRRRARAQPTAPVASSVPASAASTITGYGTAAETSVGSGPLASREGPSSGGSIGAGARPGRAARACGEGAVRLGRGRSGCLVARVLGARRRRGGAGLTLAPVGGRLGPSPTGEREGAGDVPVRLGVLEDVGRQRFDRRAVAGKRVDVVHASTRVPVADHALRAGVERPGGRDGNSGHDPGEGGENGDAANHEHLEACPIRAGAKRLGGAGG